jgi:hypothetical protein
MEFHEIDFLLLKRSQKRIKKSIMTCLYLFVTNKINVINFKHEIFLIIQNLHFSTEYF